MSILNKIFSGAAGDLIEKVGNTVDKFVTTKEEKEKLNQEMTKIINEHEVKLKELAGKEVEAYLKDTQSARDSNARIQESQYATWWAKNTGYFLDVFIGSIWGSLTIFIALRQLKLVTATDADFTGILSLYSTVTAVFMICVQFHRGSSMSSGKKQEALERMTKK